jgi:hypothetical protein
MGALHRKSRGKRDESIIAGLIANALVQKPMPED